MAAERFDELMVAAQSNRLNRRDVLKRAAALGLSAPAIAALLAACGGDEAAEVPAETATTASRAAPGDAADGTPTSAATEPSGGAATAVSTLEASPTTALDETDQRGGGGDLRILWWQAPVMLNGHLSIAGKDIGAILICMEPLAEYDSAGQLVPILASEIPSLENGGVAEDRTSITWKLREGVTWHDGEAFTADDVVFTYEYLSTPETNATTRALYANVASVEAIDDHTITITFANPVAALFNPFVSRTGTILPEHILRDFVGERASEAPFNLGPVGTGPYKVVDFRPGDLVLYEIHRDYWDPGKPFFDNVELKGGGDAASAARAVIQTGEADWAWNIEVEKALLESLGSGGEGKLVTWPGAGTEKLVINHSDPETEKDGQRSHRDVPHPHFQELKVRQAIALAIPRDIIAEELYGTGGTATGYTMNESPDYMPEGITWEFDVDRANQLLDEVGAERGDDGIRELNGRSMRWVSSATTSSLRQREQEILKQWFSELGIELEIVAIEASVYFDASNVDSFQHLYYDLAIERNAADIYPLRFYLRYFSADPLRDIAQKENGWAGRNIQRYQNSAFNDLFAQAESAVYEAEYIPIFQEMQRHAVENVADIGLVSRNNVSAVSNDLSGYQPSQFSREVWDIRNWRRD